MTWTTILWGGADQLFITAPFGAVAGAPLIWRLGSKPGNRGHCRCGYDLTGNESGTCPECGTRFEPGDLWVRYEKRRPRSSFLRHMLLVLAGFSCCALSSALVRMGFENAYPRSISDFTNGVSPQYTFWTTVFPIILFVPFGLGIVILFYRRLAADQKEKAVGLAFGFAFLGVLLYGCTRGIAYFD